MNDRKTSNIGLVAVHDLDANVPQNQIGNRSVPGTQYDLQAVLWIQIRIFWLDPNQKKVRIWIRIQTLL
jgi:hypothetical protein